MTLNQRTKIVYIFVATIMPSSYSSVEKATPRKRGYGKLRRLKDLDFPITELFGRFVPLSEKFVTWRSRHLAHNSLWAGSRNPVHLAKSHCPS
jgi:hypothetical protein